MVVAAVLGAFAGATTLVFFYALKPGIVLDMGTDLPPIARGFYPIERDPQGLTYAWSRDQAELALPGLDRRSPWTATVRFRGGRPDPATLPEVRLAVDGEVRATKRADNTYQDLTIDIPPRASGRGTVITLLASSTFVPGPGDPRALGVMVDEIRVMPGGDTVALVPRRTLGSAIIACGLFGLAFGAIGLTSVPAVSAAVVVAIGQAAAIVRGVGPYMPYGGNMAWFAFAIAAMLVAGALLAERLGRRRLRNTARFAAAFAASALYLELLVLLHPSMPTGEAVFQAHRFEWVLSGRYVFTSVAPGGYQFPHAIGLYVFAAPWTLLGHGLPYLVSLLRVVVATSDALAGLLLYLMVLRASGDRVAGAMAAALFHLVPLGMAVQTTGNLTNAFGQSCFLATLGLVSLGVVRQRAPRGVLLATVAALAAALSHAGTFAIAVPVLVFVAASFAWRGNEVLRTSARPIATVALLTGAIAVAVYYAHFWETYRDQVARIASDLGQPAAASDPGGRSVAGRAAAVPHELRTYYGLPLLALAASGTAWFWKRGQRDRLALTLSGWSAGCGAFLLLGVLTPVDVPYYLAFFPAVAMLAALGAAWLWRGGMASRAASAILLALATARGVMVWLRPLTGWAWP
jgi:hypothetical protein